MSENEELDLDALRKQMHSDLDRFNIHLLREQGAQIGIKSVTTYKKERLMDLIIDKQLQIRKSYKAEFLPQDNVTISTLERERLLKLTANADEVDGDMASGTLELSEGIDGFLRMDSMKRRSTDIFVPQSVINEFELRYGDHIVGKSVPLQGNSIYSALISVTSINGSKNKRKLIREEFGDMACHPSTLRLPLIPDDSDRKLDPAHENILRLMDIFSPVALGHSNLVLSTSPQELTPLIAAAVRSFIDNDTRTLVLSLSDKAHLTTTLRQEFGDDVVYATSGDATPRDNQRVAQLMLEAVKRKVELGKDTAIVITNIATLSSVTGRNVLDTDFNFRTFFSSARQLKSGGSLTIMAFGHLLGPNGQHIYETLVPFANSLSVIRQERGILSPLRFDILNSFTDFYIHNTAERAHYDKLVEHIKNNGGAYTDEELLSIEKPAEKLSAKRITRDFLG